MLEFLYEIIFTPEFENYQIFSEKGYLAGGFICLIFTLITSGIFYLLLGNYREEFARVWKWLLTLIINIVLVFFITVYWESFKVFDFIQDWGSIPNDIWMFSLVNALYAVLLFFLLSLLFKRFSTQSYKIPF